MLMVKETSKLVKNDKFVQGQRTAINQYLIDQVITTHENPRSTRSFYRQRPIDDPDAETIYELAGGDPTLNALLSYTHQAELDLDTVLQSEEDPIARQKAALTAKASIEHLSILEDQYRDPHQFPLKKGR